MIRSSHTGHDPSPDPKRPGPEDGEAKTHAPCVPALWPSVLIRPRTNIYLSYCNRGMGEARPRGQTGGEREGPALEVGRRGDMSCPCGPPVLGDLGTKTDQRPGRPRARLVLLATATHKHASPAPRQGGDVGPSVCRQVAGPAPGSHLATPCPPFPYVWTVDSTALPAGFPAHSCCSLSSPLS